MLEVFLRGLDEVDTQLISQRFYAPVGAPRDAAPATVALPGCGRLCETVDAFEGKLELSGRKVDEYTAENSSDPSFSIVIPFARHLRFLPACLRSVANLRSSPSAASLQVIIANDDLQIADHALLGLAPEAIRDSIEVVSCRPARGISRALNDAISNARNEWILFLDCDDLLEPEALLHLTEYISAYPQVRYISSCIIDIDEQDRVLRYRRRAASGPSALLYSGMHAGHLKSIRRDAFEIYGAFHDLCDGAQDYEFALRVCFFEPLLFIPEYLYRYRYHAGTFSVSQQQQQDEVVRRIARTYRCAAMIDNGLLGPSSGLSLEFRGAHAAEWESLFEESLVSKGDALLEVSTGDSMPTPRNRRFLILHMAYHLMQFGAAPWKSPFEIRMNSANIGGLSTAR